jgi:hypothetical protein
MRKLHTKLQSLLTKKLQMLTPNRALSAVLVVVGEDTQAMVQFVPQNRIQLKVQRAVTAYERDD